MRPTNLPPSRRATQERPATMGWIIKSLIQEGAGQSVFPGAAALVAHEGRVVCLECAGYRSLIPERLAMSTDTIFDLASLTKPLATALCIMKLVDDEKLFLDQSLGKTLPQTDLKDKGNLSLRLLLTHCAGLADWKPFHEKLMGCPLEDRKRLLREWIIEEPFAYEPGKGNVYSDLGFMLLEWVIEEKTGKTLPEYVEKRFYGPLGLKRTFFSPSPLSPPTGGGEDAGDMRNPPRSPFTREGEDPLPEPLPPGDGRRPDSRFRGKERLGIRDPKEAFAATEDCPWRRRVLQGEVHDDNAWTLGGYSGHAGLFSTAEEVYAVAHMLREHALGTRADFFKAETVREFFRRQDIVPGSDWALGWDTRAPEGSSAGKYFSRDSVGHTGFTGTSLWMDLEKDVIAILLTNRVHPKRDNDRIKQFRPVFHDAVMEELGFANAENA